jgi:hypothetical protein
MRAAASNAVNAVKGGNFLRRFGTSISFEKLAAALKRDSASYYIWLCKQRKFMPLK